MLEARRENPPPIVTLTVAELEADPHGVLRHHRAITPFVAHERGGYMVLRAADVEQLIKDPRTRQIETEYAKLRGFTEGALYENFEFSMLFSNDPAHRRRRSPFTRTFAAKMILEMRPHIRAIAEGLVDEWHDEGEIDLVERYAALIPARVASRLLGLPQADIPHFTGLVYSVCRILSLNFAPQDIPEMERAARELQLYVADLLSARRHTPAEDFISSYVADVDEKAEMSPIEVIVQMVILIMAATDTTRVAMASQVAVLLQHPDQWQAVCHDPALIPGAVAEGLRYEPSVGSVSRIPLEDIELDGQILPAGQYATLSIMSAMRDETVYDRPDAFDIRRTDHRRLHPIFGGGAHRCIGEALARIELEEGLATLAARIPQLRLADGPPKMSGHSGIRRISPVRVAWPV
jgi:cytochrome P450